LALGLGGKVAIVTGAASGIGRAVAQAFVRERARVIAADIEICEIDGALPARCDVTKPAQVEALVARAIDEFGRLDCAVNNAGVEGARAAVADYDDAEWARVVNVNLSGVFFCMKHELRAMTRQGAGAIVNVASIFGLRGAAEAPAYAASKHGVIGLTRAAALEVAEHGVRVNAVCPGYVATPMVMDRALNARRDPAAMARIVAREPMQRLGSPREIAEAILWLCSDAASFVTGEALAVDGGFLAR
jgi:NAD(P)-dependent dehydrogenase (short-subunit alcohol dehydrogenase family)